MSVSIKTCRNIKHLNKKIIKDIKRLLSDKPSARIGLYWDESLSQVFSALSKTKKVQWFNSRIVPLVEYADDQTVMFEDTLKSQFIDKIDISQGNYTSLKDRINKLSVVDKLDDLYKFADGLDLIIFGIDKRGNFVFNDYESKVSYINYASNGNKIISPGIKSIMLAKKIICIVIDEEADDIVRLLNTKKIDKDDFITLLNLHNNITLFTTYDLLKKKEVNKEEAQEDYSILYNELFGMDYGQDYPNEIDKEIEAHLEKEKNEEEEIEEIINEIDEEPEDEIDKYIEMLEKKNANSLESTEERAKNILDELKDLEPTEDDLNDEEILELEKEIIQEIQEEEQQEQQEESDNDYLVDDEINIEEEVEDTSYDNLDIEEEFTNLNDSTEIDDLNIDSDNENEINKLRQVQYELEQELRNLEDSSNKNNSIEVYKDENVDSNVANEVKHDLSIEEENIFEKLKKQNKADVDTIKIVEDDKGELQFEQELENKPIRVTPVPLQQNVQPNVVQNVTPTPSYSNEIPKYVPREIKREYVIPNPKTKEQIQRIIEIKQEALKTIEELIIKNRLESKKTSYNPITTEFYKVEYNPGLRPTPMLMYYTDPNKEVYNETVQGMIQTYKFVINNKQFNTSNSHYWNMGAYVSFNEQTNEVDLISFSNFSTLVFLLRAINKPLYFYVKKDIAAIISALASQYENEISLKSI